ncbi:MAG: hypothetical protein GY950_01725 [bacterium]|nr:hypothetical protein [bacterium]
MYHRGFDVILPAFEGAGEDLIQDHRENLKSCDAAIIYYGSGNELWMRTKTRDLAKIYGFGRTRPLHVKAVFLAPPPSRQKEYFRSHDWLVLDGMEGFSPGLMKPFMKTFKSIEKIETS